MYILIDFNLSRLIVIKNIKNIYSQVNKKSDCI
jgi:hypothetical protein